MFGFRNRATLNATITELRASKAKIEGSLAERNLELIRARSEGVTKGRLAKELLGERDAAVSTLNEIAAMETAGSAPIGKKMAAHARNGVKAVGEATRRG